MIALIYLDGLNKLIPSLIGIDGIQITAVLQHFFKGFLDLGFPEPRRVASLVAIVFVVAVPHIVAFAGTAQTPDFVAIELAAITTDDFTGKRVFSAHFSPAL